MKLLKEIARAVRSPLLIGALIGTGIPLAYYSTIDKWGFRRSVQEHLAQDIVVWCCVGLAAGVLVDWAKRRVDKPARFYIDEDGSPKQVLLRRMRLCALCLGAAAACAVFGVEYLLVGWTAKYLGTGALLGVALGILFGKRLLRLALVGAALGLVYECLELSILIAPGWITLAWLAWILKRGHAAAWELALFAGVAALSCAWFIVIFVAMTR